MHLLAEGSWLENSLEQISKQPESEALQSLRHGDLLVQLWAQMQQHELHYYEQEAHSKTLIPLYQFIRKELETSNQAGEKAEAYDLPWCDWCGEYPSAPRVPCKSCLELGADHEKGPPDKQMIPATKYRVLLAGSRQATDKQLQAAKRMVERCIELGWEIVVGDNPEGVDAAVVESCREKQYKQVIVVGIEAKPRNGGVEGARYEQQGASYSERDQLMAKASQRGVFLRNRQSQGKGTLAGYEFMKKLGKTVHLIEFED